MTPPVPLIAEKVSRSYSGTRILDTVSLQLNPGEVTALLGQSGAGKSTLLRLFAGLERPDGGAIRLGDKALSDSGTMIPAEARRIGLIFQDFALFPHMTAIRNVMFGLAGLAKSDAEERAQNWLTRIGLAHRVDAYPHQLSGGEQQRVAIARALAPEPVAILMDEPFSGLDPSLRADVRDEALSTVRAAGIPSLLVTHDAGEAMIAADQLAIMRDGQIVQAGSPETVYMNPIDEPAARALGPIVLAPARRAADGDPLETPFGPIPAPTDLSGTSATLGIRPEGFVIDEKSPICAQVQASRRNGGLLQLDIQIDEFKTQILVPALLNIKAGDTVRLQISPQFCTIWP